MIETTRLADLDAAARRALTRRTPVADPAVTRAAREIVEAVRRGGDAALQDASHRFGGGPRDGRLTRNGDDFAAATERLDSTLLGALERAAGAIAAVHRPQLPEASVVDPLPGVTVERRWAPLRRVGVYAPGGLAAYPSSVLMAAVPARLAGVAEVVVASPADPEGNTTDAVLAACGVAGVDELYVMGGAQAVAALAFGTESVSPVDKIVGPGNAWVTAAKLAVFGSCGIDLPAGPSEALEIADGSAQPRAVAADLISQAEHGPDSVAVLVAIGEAVARAVLDEIPVLLADLERAEVIRTALRRHGRVIVASDLSEACRFAEAFAPEHLGIHVSDPESVIASVPSAGSVFAGHYAPHSAGDYATGANHVLPTGGLARAYGPLGVEDFGSYRQIQRITRDGLNSLLPTVAAIASGEGLTAHRRAVEIRFEEAS